MRLPISRAAAEARRPPPPEELVGALQGTVHRDLGVSRPARAVRVGRAPIAAILLAAPLGCSVHAGPALRAELADEAARLRATLALAAQVDDDAALGIALLDSTEASLERVCSWTWAAEQWPGIGALVGGALDVAGLDGVGRRVAGALERPTPGDLRACVEGGGGAEVIEGEVSGGD